MFENKELRMITYPWAIEIFTRIFYKLQCRYEGIVWKKWVVYYNNYNQALVSDSKLFSQRTKIIKIQSLYRSHLAKRKLEKLRKEREDFLIAEAERLRLLEELYNKSAILIQKIFRGYIKQKQYKELVLLNRMAHIICSAWIRFKYSFKKELNRISKAQQWRAAVTIQRLYRGFKGRKRAKLFSKISKVDQLLYEKELMRSQYNKNFREIGATIMIQNFIEGIIRRKETKNKVIERKNNYATKIQRFCKKWMRIKKYIRNYRKVLEENKIKTKKVLIIQSLYRKRYTDKKVLKLYIEKQIKEYNRYSGNNETKYENPKITALKYIKQTIAIKKIQKLYRGYKSRKLYKTKSQIEKAKEYKIIVEERRKRIIKIQSVIRMFIVKKRILKLKKIEKAKLIWEWYIQSKENRKENIFF